MTPETFIEIIRNEVVDENQKVYQSSLCKNCEESEQVFEDEILIFYDSLTPVHKKLVMSLLRRISVDAVSSLLAIISGDRILDHHRERFSLSYSGGEELSEDLTSLFWESEDENS